MSKEQNLKALALGGELVATHDFDRFGEFFAEHIVDHDPADGQAAGLEGTKHYWRGLLESFPDSHSRPTSCWPTTTTSRWYFGCLGRTSVSTWGTLQQASDSTSARSRWRDSRMGSWSSVGAARTSWGS